MKIYHNHWRAMASAIGQTLYKMTRTMADLGNYK